MGMNAVEPVEIIDDNAPPSGSGKPALALRVSEKDNIRYSFTAQNDCNMAVCGRVALVIVLWIVSIYVCTYAVHEAGNRQLSSEWSISHQNPLPDYGFELFPYVEVQTVPIIGLDGLFIMICTVFLCGVFAVHRVRSLVMRRTFVLWSVLILFRAVTMSCTAQPDPNPACRDLHTGSWDWKPAYYPGGITCGDLMYSGHAVFYLLSALVIQQYTRSVVLQVIVWFISMLGMWGLIAVRVHYTVDVVIAIYITWSAFVMYHWLMDPKSTKLQQRWSTVHAVISWLEYMPPETLQPVDEAALRRARAKGRSGGSAEEKKGLLGGQGDDDDGV